MKLFFNTSIGKKIAMALSAIFLMIFLLQHFMINVTSVFNPKLYNYLSHFMGTNPIYMANGGDVKAGIPNYPDVNVTRGFLPAALGFDNGGEADKDVVTKVYDFIFGYFKNYEESYFTIYKIKILILNI